MFMDAMYAWHIVLEDEMLSYELVTFWIQVDKGINSEVVRSVLKERGNMPSLAAKSAHKVGYLLSTAIFFFPLNFLPTQAFVEITCLVISREFSSK